MPMDPDWLIWDQNPTKPTYTPPAGAVDAHCHVFGPEAQFPFAAGRKYTPCDASKDHLFALREFLGFERNVIVQATCHGTDNSALLDALNAGDGMARGVVSLDPRVTDAELSAMHQAGVRGVRFNFVKRLVDEVPKEKSLKIAHRIAELGWHSVVYFEAQDLADLSSFLKSLPTTVVIDHMGRPDVAQALDHPDFRLFIDLMNDEKFWCKTTCPERLTKTGPPYADVIPFMKILVETFPDRVIWGTDWPHPNMKSHMPDDGQLVDIIPFIADTSELRHKLLVQNPARLYW